MSVHISPWACPFDYQPWFAISAPYHPDFISGLKENIPGYARKWLPALKLWVVRWDFKEDLELLLSQQFKSERCPLCFSKEPCVVWLRPRVQDYGRPEPWQKPKVNPQPAPKPSAKETPRTAYNTAEQVAARALGLRLPAKIEEITAAFRKKVLEVHPDRGGSHEAFLAVRNAYEKLLQAQGAKR